MTHSNINCVMDYAMLLDEGRDTHNTLYISAVSRIDMHYQSEEMRILSHADTDVKRFLEDISSTFKMMSVVDQSVTITDGITSTHMQQRTICETTRTTHNNNNNNTSDNFTTAPSDTYSSSSSSYSPADVVEGFAIETSSSTCISSTQAMITSDSVSVDDQNTTTTSTFHQNSYSSNSAYQSSSSSSPHTTPTHSAKSNGSGEVTFDAIYSHNDEDSVSFGFESSSAADMPHSNSSSNNTIIDTTNSSTTSDKSYLTPQVSSLWALEILKVKREASLATHSKIEALLQSRAANEHRARVWARGLIEERRREKESAVRALEVLKEHRMTRFAHAHINHGALIKDYLAEVLEAKALQHARDRRVFTLTGLLVGAMYVAVYSGWDASRRGATWSAWLVRNARQVCSFVACKAATSNYYEHNTQLTSPPRVSALQLHPIDTSLSTLSSTTTTSFTSSVVSSVLTLSPMTYLFTLMLPYAFMAPTDFLTGSHNAGAVVSDWSLFIEYCKCGMFFVCRGIPPLVTSKIVSFAGLPQVITWCIALYSFSDLLYRIVFGPLLPL
eukprot:gene25366-31817_t